MKRKVIFTSLVLLCMMLIVGVGFSFWYVKNDPVTVTSPGNVIAYGVVDNGVLQVDIVNSSGVSTSESERKVVFGKPKSPIDATTVTPPWLVFNDILEEHLTIYIKVTVTYDGMFEIEDDILRSGASVKNDLKLFDGPGFSIESRAGCDADLDDPRDGVLHIYNVNTEGSVILKVTYKWPELFGVINDNANYNPYYYFNGHQKGDLLDATTIGKANQILGLTGGEAWTTDTDKTYADFAVAYLTKLHEVSQDIVFKITFTEVTS